MNKTIYFGIALVGGLSVAAYVTLQSNGTNHHSPTIEAPSESESATTVSQESNTLNIATPSTSWLNSEESDFTVLNSEQLSELTPEALEAYLIDFRFVTMNQPDFEEMEIELVNTVFELVPEVAVEYVSVYAPHDNVYAQMLPKLIATFYEREEAVLKEAFYRYLDVYQKLPSGWFVTIALRTEMSAYFDGGDRTAIPTEIASYSLDAFLEGDISSYMFATYFNEPNAITHEQMVAVFLKTSPQTETDSLSEFIFDVIALNDPRTYEHILAFLPHHSKKLNFYRQLTSYPEIPLERAVNRMMNEFSNFSDEDKHYIAMMALDYGNTEALQFLLKNPTRNFMGPVDVNIEFLLKRKIQKVEGVTDVIGWAQEHSSQLTFFESSGKFGI